jgi:hypothetical protein
MTKSVNYRQLTLVRSTVVQFCYLKNVNEHHYGNTVKTVYMSGHE